MEFRFSDDVLKCRGLVTNIPTFTCPCVHTPSLGTLGSLESAERGHCKDGSSKADGWWWMVIPPGLLTVRALQYKPRDLALASPRKRCCPSWDFPGDPAVKNPPSNVGDSGLIPAPGSKIPHALRQLSTREKKKSLCFSGRPCTAGSPIPAAKKKEEMLPSLLEFF